MPNNKKDFPERAVQAIAREATDAASVAILESRVVPILERIEANTKGAMRDLGKSVAVATKGGRAAQREGRTQSTGGTQDRHDRQQGATQAASQARAVDKAVRVAVRESVSATVTAQAKATAREQVKASRNTAPAQERRTDGRFKSKSADALDLNRPNRRRTARSTRDTGEFQDTAGRATGGPVWGAIQEAMEMAGQAKDGLSSYREWRAERRQTQEAKKGAGRGKDGKFAPAQAQGTRQSSGGLLDSVMGLAGDWAGNKAKGVAGGIAGRLAARGGILGKIGGLAGGLLGTGATGTVAAATSGGGGILSKLFGGGASAAGAAGGSGASVLGKIGGKIPLLGGLISGGVEYMQSGSTAKALGAGGGAMAGTAIGATLGSVIPGLGTVIGGIAGGMIGEWAGKNLGALTESILGLNETVQDSDKSREKEAKDGKKGGAMGLLGDFWDKISGTASSAYHTGKEAVSSGFDSVKGAVSTGYNATKEAGGKVVYAAKGAAGAVAGYLGIGDSVKKYESGSRGVATVSSGAGDPGGASYGTYQLASKTGTLQRFLSSQEGGKYGSEFAGLKPGTSAFNAKWQEIAAKDPQGLHQAEKDFISRTHYQPQAGKASALGFDMSNPGIQDAVWSGSIQHGRFDKVLSAAAAGRDVKSMSPEDQIKAIYAARSQYADSQGVSKAAGSGRYSKEVQDVLAVNATYQGGASHAPTKGNTALAEAAASTGSKKTVVAESSGPVQEIQGRRSGEPGKKLSTAPTLNNTALAEAASNAPRDVPTPTPSAMASSPAKMNQGVEQRIAEAEAAGDTEKAAKWRQFQGQKAAGASSPSTVPATKYVPEKTQEDLDREELRNRAAGMREAMARQGAVEAKSGDTLPATNIGAWKDPNKTADALPAVNAGPWRDPNKVDGVVGETAKPSFREGLSRAASFAQGIPQVSGLKLPRLASDIQAKAGSMGGGIQIPGMDALTQKLSQMADAFGNMKLDREKDTASQDVPHIPMDFDDKLLMLMAHDRI